jgi:hypothetical protein
VVAGILVGVAALSRAHLATAQGDQFGTQARADAASRAIVLAVQQGISALPPTSGQSIIYAYNPHTDVFERSEKLGPFSLRTPETVGSGNFSLRFAASYFALPATLGPIDNELVFDDPTVSPSQFFKVGTEIDAKVGVFDFTVNYGITRDIEATFTLPIVVVDAHAREIYSADPVDTQFLGFRESIPVLNTAIAQHELLLYPNRTRLWCRLQRRDAGPASASERRRWSSGIPSRSPPHAMSTFQPEPGRVRGVGQHLDPAASDRRSPPRLGASAPRPGIRL